MFLFGLWCVDEEEILDELVAVRCELQSLKAQQTDELQSLKARREQDRVAMEAVTEEMNAKTEKHIAFTAISPASKPSSRLKWWRINVGGGWSTDFNVFTAPVTGVYMFAATVLGETEEDPLLVVTHTTPGGTRRAVSLRSAPTEQGPRDSPAFASSAWMQVTTLVWLSCLTITTETFWGLHLVWYTAHSLASISFPEGPCCIQDTPSKIKWKHNLHGSRYLLFRVTSIPNAPSAWYLLTLLKRAGVSYHDILKIYLAMIRPILEYACPVGHSSLTKTQTDRLESIQRKVTQILHPDQSYEQSLSTLGVPTLQQRREELSKTFFTRVMDPSHRLQYMLPKKRTVELWGDHYQSPRTYPGVRCRTERYKNSFIPYGVSNWQ